jgi:uncharacterized protein YbaP (TraB family)
MQKKIMLYLSFIAQLFSIQVFSQSNDAAASMQDNNQNSLLWRVTGRDLKEASFIFGTIHAICADDYFFTDMMQMAFNECQQLVLEVDIDDSKMAGNYQENMSLPKGKQLRDYFSDEKVYDEFSTKLKRVSDIDIETFSQFKPFVLISALAMKGLACPVVSSYEMKLNEMSKKMKMSVRGLETASFQLEIFDKMSNEEIKNLLMESLTEDNSNVEKQHQLVEFYKQQNLIGLQQMISESNEIKGHEEELLTNRNKNWAKLLPSMMQKKSSFIAVGAAHLPGDTGVLNLLRLAGYQLEAIK